MRADIPLRTFWATTAAQMRSASCSAVSSFAMSSGAWSQVPRRVLRGIGRALRHAVPGSDRRSLGPLAPSLLAFASGDDAAFLRRNFRLREPDFRAVAADGGHCRTPRAARLLTCLLLLAA